MTREQLLADISSFLARDDVHIKESTFGKLAVNDGKFVNRLRGGTSISIDTFEKARKFMLSYGQDKSRPDGDKIEWVA